MPRHSTVLPAVTTRALAVRWTRWQAVHYFRLSADQGFAQAQHDVGSCYSDGTGGLVQDWDMAVRLWRQAVEKGNADAQSNLGVCYAHGRSVTQNDQEAVRLWRLAVEQGHVGAWGSLGVSYLFGTGAAQDLEASVHHIRLAADQGVARAQGWLAYLYEHGMGTKRDSAGAVRWYRAAAAQRDVWALAGLGMCFEKGRGVAQSNAESSASYAEASALGGAESIFLSGTNHLYELGHGKGDAPEPFTIQLAVRDLAFAGKLGQACGGSRDARLDLEPARGGIRLLPGLRRDARAQVVRRMSRCRVLRRRLHSAHVAGAQA